MTGFPLPAADVAVVVPVLDEAAVVVAVVRELRSAFDLVICVDDGSRDDSAALAAAAGAVVVRHAVNLGQGAALQTGFDVVLAHTDAAHVVTFDSDGQHAVGDAVAMVHRAVAGDVDVVLGTRAGGVPSGSPARRLLLRLALRYSRWSSGLALTDTHNGLRVLSRSALEHVRLRQRGMAHASELEELVARHGLRWVEHPVTITYTDYSRAKGQSNLNAINVLFDLASARLRVPS